MCGYWKFLDKNDFNLIYSYTNWLFKNNENFSFSHEITADEEKSRNAAFYLIWFTYRYVLQCETLNDALNYGTKETFSLLFPNYFFRKKLIYVGIGDNKFFLNCSDNNVHMILEILYNRYSFIEQLECYCRYGGRKKQQKCIPFLNKCKEIERNFNYNI